MIKATATETKTWLWLLSERPADGVGVTVGATVWVVCDGDDGCVLWNVNMTDTINRCLLQTLM